MGGEQRRRNGGDRQRVGLACSSTWTIAFPLRKGRCMEACSALLYSDLFVLSVWQHGSLENWGVAWEGILESGIEVFQWKGRVGDREGHRTIGDMVTRNWIKIQNKETCFLFFVLTLHSRLPWHWGRPAIQIPPKHALEAQESICARLDHGHLVGVPYQHRHPCPCPCP